MKRRREEEEGRRSRREEEVEEEERGESARSLRRTVVEYYWLFALVTGQILSLAAQGGYTNGSPCSLIHALFVSLCVCKS